MLPRFHLNLGTLTFNLVTLTLINQPTTKKPQYAFSPPPAIPHKAAVSIPAH